MCTGVSMVSTTKAAMQEQQSYPTFLGCSSQPRFQIQFKNILWVFYHLLYTFIGPTTYSPLDGGHCHNVGRTVSLSCTQLHNPFLAHRRHK